ncbi:hypothetical protein GEV33_002487 [Tenebrio molitor]|uniref:RNA-directed DNA polymerase n=1 Tax=Tenebrio molitor TaxID=7067 RepID=A0A8J6HT34_TENMO|nr:hypothetical protein GEV33_002487 [Tenebrio molitor]
MDSIKDDKVDLNEIDKLLQMKGKDNVVADILSRYPSDGEASYEYPREQPIVAMFEVHNTPEMLQLISDLQQHQTDDPVLRPIIENKRSGGAAPDSRTQRVWAQYNLTNNVLVHRSQNSNDDCIAVPESLIIKLVDYHHQLLGHFGSTKVYNSMKGEYYWPNMYRSIKKRLRSCDLCQKTKCSNRPHQGPLTPILYDHVGDLVCVDFYGPLPTGRLGASYVFVVIDAFSKFLKLYPLRKATAKVAAKRLIENYAGYIKPKCALSDHGTQFLSSTWEKSLRAADIQPTLSSIRHPESNPSERVMPELGRIFRAYCRENHASWVNHLNNIEDCLNYVPHISTGFSPHEILYGRKPPNPLDAVTSGLLPQRAPLSREEIHAKVRENLRHHANLRQRNQKGETTILELDDWVLLKNKVTSDTRTQQFAKFMPLYRGPYKIIAKPHPNTYQIADPVSNEIKGVYNMTNMTCNSTTDETNKSAKSSSSAIPGHIHSSERTDSPRRIHHSGASTIPAHPPVLPSTRYRLPTMRCLTPHLRSNARPEANVMNANGLSDPDFRYRPRQFGERRGKYIKVEQTFSRGSRLVEVRGYDRFVLCNRCWRTRGGRPIRLGNRPRRIPTETSRRIKASFTRVIDPTLQRINFTTLLGRRHPPGPHRRAGPHTGLSLAEEPETRSNSYLARECRGEEGPRGLSEDTDGVVDQRRKKDSEDLPPARSPKDSSWISSPRPDARLSATNDEESRGSRGPSSPTLLGLRHGARS